MDDMYHTCIWCKHFSKEDGRCLKDLFSVEMDTEYLLYLEKYYGKQYPAFDVIDFHVCINDPDNFYCKEWE